MFKSTILKLILVTFFVLAIRTPVFLTLNHFHHSGLEGIHSSPPLDLLSALTATCDRRGLADYNCGDMRAFLDAKYEQKINDAAQDLFGK